MSTSNTRRRGIFLRINWKIQFYFYQDTFQRQSSKSQSSPLEKNHKSDIKSPKKNSPAHCKTTKKTRTVSARRKSKININCYYQACFHGKWAREGKVKLSFSRTNFHSPAISTQDFSFDFSFSFNSESLRVKEALWSERRDKKK